MTGPQALWRNLLPRPPSCPAHGLRSPSFSKFHFRPPTCVDIMVTMKESHPRSSLYPIPVSLSVLFTDSNTLCAHRSDVCAAAQCMRRT